MCGLVFPASRPVFVRSTFWGYCGNWTHKCTIFCGPLSLGYGLKQPTIFCGPLSWGYGLKHSFNLPVLLRKSTIFCGPLSWGYGLKQSTIFCGPLSWGYGLKHSFNFPVLLRKLDHHSTFRCY